MKRQTWSKALVLKTKPYGESDVIATLLTRDHGKLAVFLRGARNSKKRYAGLDLFVSFDACLSPPRGQGHFFQLDAMQNTQLRLELRHDLVKFSQVSYMVECVHLFLGEQDPQPQLFDWMEGVLDKLKHEGLGALDQVKTDLEMLRWFGYFPSLSQCYECNRVLSGEEKVFFSFSRGGLVCPRCYQTSAGEWIQVKKMRQGDLSCFRGPLNAFVRYTLGISPRSQKIREELSHAG